MIDDRRYALLVRLDPFDARACSCAHVSFDACPNTRARASAAHHTHARTHSMSIRFVRVDDVHADMQRRPPITICWRGIGQRRAIHVTRVSLPAPET